MSRFVRASKYRHVFGQTGKKEFNIENAKVSGSAWDTNLIACSSSYISLNWNASGGGAFAILPLPSPFKPPAHYLPARLPDVIPLARGHTATVLDTDWNPFDDSVVASGGEDGKLLIWKVDEEQFDNWGAEKWVPIDFDPVARIDASARKIGQVLFHPTASHVLATASGDHVIKLWDLNNTDDARSVLSGHTDTIQSIAFNPSGTLMATTCRDRKLRLFDPRSGAQPVRITEGHGGIKGTRVTWMGDKDNIATTGFSKMSDRQVSVWETGGLGNIKTISLDQSAGVVMPFWSDNNILFLAGKGDGNIRYYEWESDSLYSLAEHKTSEPQRGMCFLPRRALSVSDCEIARAYKVTTSYVEPIAFVVPRRSDSFQSDIFPDAPSSEPSLSATDFFQGRSAQPKLVSLENGSISTSNTPITRIESLAPTPITRMESLAPTPITRMESLAPTPYTRMESLAPTPITRSESLTPSKTFSAPPPESVYLPPTPMTQKSDSLPVPSPMQRESSVTYSPVETRASLLDSNVNTALQEENERLNNELREARSQIRHLELQVEGMRANAQRAAKALLEGGGI